MFIETCSNSIYLIIAVYSVVSDSLTTWFTRELAMVFREDLILLCHDSSMRPYTYKKIFANWLGIWFPIPQQYTHNSHSNHIDYVTMKVGINWSRINSS